MAMATTASTTALRMKLLVDTGAQRVLFAEASKDVVDFLFSLLALPVGTVVTLLGNESVAGSVGSLYRSVENLDRSFVRPGVDMDALLRPGVPPPADGSAAASLFLLPPRPVQELVHGVPNSAPAAGGGFVQGNMTYTVMDDLSVAPVSTISSIAVFNALAARDDIDIGAARERTVLIGNTEALKILKASFESKTVLTDVFIRNRAPGPGLLAR